MSKEYEVGFCKPPKKTQFQKGQSGNPGGRAKVKLRKPFVTTPSEVRQIFMDAMEDELTVVENGRKKKMPAILAIYKQLAVKAVKGDFRTAKFLAETYAKVIQDDDDQRVRLMEILMDLDRAREQEYQDSVRNRQSQSTSN